LEAVVKWFDSAKGFGFLTDGNGVDYFAHYSQIEGEGYKSLNEGQKVTFDAVQTDRGLAAENIAVVE